MSTDSLIFFSPQDLSALWLTLKLASVTTIILLIIGTPLAWWLSRTRSMAGTAIEALVALPLILPPTVIGFYLLIAFSPQHGLGSLWQSFSGHSLAFSFSGLVIGSVIYSLPFVVQPLQNNFQQLDRGLLEVAATMGCSKSERFWAVVLPLSQRAFLTAAVLGFAHTLGEFGVVLMIGGNIPGETQVLSIALFDHVESLQYNQAHALAGLLLLSSFALLLLILGINRRSQRGAFL